MQADVYFINVLSKGRLAIMPRPRGGDWLVEEIASWAQGGLEVVVSLLEEAEVWELDLTDEEPLCMEAGLEFRRLPVPDVGVPQSAGDISKLVEQIVRDLNDGRGVGIHCRMGIGRSALLAACVLLKVGIAEDDAWRSIAAARGLDVPDTVVQRQWVASWWAGREL